MSSPPDCRCKSGLAGHYCRDCEMFVCWRCWDLDQAMCKECVRDLLDQERTAKYEDTEQGG